MKGVPGSAYEGLWKLDIMIPENYPLAPPKITFLTPICHPNVHFKVATTLGPWSRDAHLLIQCGLDWRDLP